MSRMIPKGYIPLSEDMSKRFKIFRHVNNLTIPKMAEMLNIPKHRYDNIERLEIGSFSKKILCSICALKDIPYPCTPEFFLDFDNSYIENLPFNLFSEAVRIYLDMPRTEFAGKMHLSYAVYGNRVRGWYMYKGMTKNCDFSEDERKIITSIWVQVKADIEESKQRLIEAKYGDLSDMSGFMSELQKLRIDNELSITEFMHSIGRSPRVWDKWLNNGNPSTDDIAKINELYGTDFVI